MVKGETMLSLGKTFQKMTAGQAYKIPPTGLAAHSNLNLSDEPVEAGPPSATVFSGSRGSDGTVRPPGMAPSRLRPAAR